MKHPFDEKVLVDVIFRVYRDGDVIAIFPGIPGTNSPDTCQCYQHVGQHGHGNLRAMMTGTRAAKDLEFSELARELLRIGYVLHVVKRATSKHRNQRYEELNRHER